MKKPTAITLNTVRAAHAWAAACLLLAAPDVRAAPGNVDLTFDAGSGLDGTVNLIVPQPDGRVLVAGPFANTRGVRRANLARLNADGSGDATFDAEVGASAMALQPDGKLLVVAGAYGLKRLHADGRLDDSFASAIEPRCGPDGCSSDIVTILLQPDGRILVGGFFATPGTIPAAYGLARLHPDGRLDTSFRASVGTLDPETGSLRESIIALALRADGKVWVGGNFTTINGVPRQNVARLHEDGRLDTAFNPSSSIDGFIYSMISQPDGKLLVAGEFTTANRANRSLARLNGNGSLDTTFAAGVDLYDHVRGIALQPDNRILVTGSLNRNAWAGERVTRLESDGRRDPSFRTNTGDEGISPGSMALQADGRVLLGGYYIVSPDDRRPVGLIRIEPDGAPDHSFSSHAGLIGYASSAISRIAVQPDGMVLIAGESVNIRASRHGVARLAANGVVDQSFTAGAGMNGMVSALALQADGAVLIGGDFTDTADTARLALARLSPDGTLDAGFLPELTSILRVSDCPPEAERFGYACNEAFTTTGLAVQPDGRILVAGIRKTTVCAEVTGCWDVDRPFVARLHPDGAMDASFIPSHVGYPGQGRTPLVIQPDGGVLVAAGFYSLNGQFRGGIARLRADGSLDPAFNAPSTEADAPVEALALQPDGRIVIAGGFASIHNTPRRGVARLFPDGGLDPSFDPGNLVQGTVKSLVLQPDGRVLIAGAFTAVTADSMVHLHVVRLHPNGRHDPTFDVQAGPSDSASTLALQPDGAVLIGGDFTTFNGVVRLRIARLQGGSPPPALSIARADDRINLSWAETGATFDLQETTNLCAPGSWTTVPQASSPNGDQVHVTVPISGPHRFFRLASP